MPSRRGETRDRRRARWQAGVRRPPEPVGPVVPQAQVPFVDVIAQDGAVIQHRVRQHLQDRPHLAAIPCEQRQTRREPAPRTGATDRHPVGVDIGSRGEPGQGVVAVVESRREGMLGREPVLHGRNERSELARESPTGGVVLRRRAHDVAAPVDPEDRRVRARNTTRRAVQANRHVADRVDLDVGRAATCHQSQRQTNERQRPFAHCPSRQPPGRTTQLGMERGGHEPDPTDAITSAKRCSVSTGAKSANHM